jgi:hypothetical protein
MLFTFQEFAMKFVKGLSLVFAVSACVGAAGCSAAPEDATDSTEEAPLTGVDATAPGFVPVAGAPEGTYFAEVKANGTGCPAGTWDTSISPDGQTFTVTFSAYEVSVEPGKLMDVKDCALAIRLHTPQGFSFSVSDFYYSGYAFMDKAGMTGKQTAKYYFQGNPIPSESLSKTKSVTGPYDSDYVFAEQVGLPDLVWSPCGTTRDLNVQSRLRLLNNSAKTGTGTMDTLSVDGNVQLKFNLHWRTCTQ